MAKWCGSTVERSAEWNQVEQAVARTLAGRRPVLQVAGAWSPGPAAQVSEAVSADELTDVKGTFEAGFACFCLGELSPEERRAFLKTWHERLGEGATAVFADRRSEGCDTAFELHELFSPSGTGLDVMVGRTFWWARYEVLPQ